MSREGRRVCRMRALPWVVLVVCGLTGLCGCGRTDSIPTVPPMSTVAPAVRDASPRFARQIDRICAESRSALFRWSKSQAGSTDGPYTILRNEAKRLRRLQPPAGERLAFQVFVTTVDRSAEAVESIYAKPNATGEIAKEMKPVGRLGTELARRMGASTCALQASGG